MFLVTSPIVINVPTRGLLTVETMHAIVQWLENLTIKRNMTSMFVNKKHRYFDGVINYVIAGLRDAVLVFVHKRESRVSYNLRSGVFLWLGGGRGGGGRKRESRRMEKGNHAFKRNTNQ